MGKIFSFALTLGLCFILHFTNGVIFEDYDDFSVNKNLQKRSAEVTMNGTTNTNVSVSNATASMGNKSLAIPGGKIKDPNIDSKIGLLNSTSVKVNNSQQLELKSNQTKVINNIINNITAKYPETSKNINNTLENLGIKDPTLFLMKLNQPNLTLHELESSINRTNLEKEINRTQAIANSEVTKAVLKHKVETALKDFNNSMANTSVISKLTNQTSNILRTNWNFTRGLPKFNMTMLLDPDYNPNLWLMRLQAPWKHVSGSNTANETEVVQVCKFDVKIATCSAQYNSWDAKAWFEFAESPDRNGINITVYERGHTPRVSFYNKVNGTDCQRFNNGSLHQICVKVYGYDKDLGPTRVCLQLGAAIFNHGVASSDFGCFRFGSAVRHEDPMEGESPHAVILNRFILANDYSNINNSTGNGSLSIKGNIMWLVLAVAIAILFDKKFSL